MNFSPEDEATIKALLRREYVDKYYDTLPSLAAARVSAERLAVEGFPESFATWLVS